MPRVSCQYKSLGLPSSISKNKKGVFAFVKSRVSSRLQSWKGKLFFKARKEVLLKSMIEAIPSYVMSLFQLPKGLSRGYPKNDGKIFVE